MTPSRVCAALLMFAVGVPAAHAWHIQGKIYCDKNSNSLIDKDTDTPLDNIRAQITSKTVDPSYVRIDDSGDTFPAALGAGVYRINLPDRVDDYKVELINLPAQYMVVLPDGGMYMVHLDATTQNKEDADFLLKNCGEVTTTTTESTTTSTSTTTTETTTTETTTTTTETTTTTTETTTTTTETTTTETTTTETTTTTSTTTTTLCIPTPEICNNGKDDDCDLLVDCVDTEDCSPLVPPCKIAKDPARIRFGVPGAGRDYFRAHGRMKLGAPVDLTTAEVGWVLSNAQGLIYKAGLQSGDLSFTGTQFVFQDNTAREDGVGLREGVWRARVDINHRGTAYFWIRAYGDLSRATDPTMTLQIHLGDQWFGVSGIWKKTSRGWIFWGRDLQTPVGVGSSTASE